MSKKVWGSVPGAMLYARSYGQLNCRCCHPWPLYPYRETTPALDWELSYALNPWSSLLLAVAAEAWGCVFWGKPFLRMWPSDFIMGWNFFHCLSCLGEGVRRGQSFWSVLISSSVRVTVQRCLTSVKKDELDSQVQVSSDSWAFLSQTACSKNVCSF